MVKWLKLDRDASPLDPVRKGTKWVVIKNEVDVEEIRRLPGYGRRTKGLLTRSLVKKPKTRKRKR